MKKLLLVALVLALFLYGAITTQAAMVNLNWIYDTVADTLQPAKNAINARILGSSFHATSTATSSTFIILTVTDLWVSSGLRDTFNLTGTSGQVLQTTGTSTRWVSTSTLGITGGGGTGDVVGPASATDNAIARFDTTTGKLIQNSAVVVTDAGYLGIGTTTPTSPLHVRGQAGNTALFHNNTGATRVIFRGNSNSNFGFSDPVLSVRNTANTQTAAIREDGLIGSSQIGTLDDTTATLVDSSVATGFLQRGLNLGNSGLIAWGSPNWWSSKDLSFTRISTGTLALGTGAASSTDGRLVLGTIEASGTSTLATSTITSLSIGSLTGVLRAVAGSVQTGLVSLASEVAGILGIGNGGTGTSTLPTTDQILVGNAVGSFDYRRITAGTNVTVSTSTPGQIQISATGGGGSSNWTDNGSYLTPLTSTDGLLITGSSTFADLKVQNSTTTGFLAIQDNRFNQHSLGFLDVQRTGTDFTLMRIRAPRGDSNEATLSLVNDLSTTDAGVDEEFVDFYNERYADSLQWGLRQAYSGTGIAKPFVIGHWNTLLGKDVGNKFIILPSGTVAVAQATATVPQTTAFYVASSTANEIMRVDRTPGTNAMTIKSDGKVGIGTTTPSDQLVVSVGNNAGAEVQSSNSGFLGLGASGGDRWRIQNNFTDTGRLELLYNNGLGNNPNTTLVTFTGTGSGIAGRMGLGTTTPTAKLSVVGAAGQAIAGFFSNMGSTTMAVLTATSTVQHASILVGFAQDSLARVVIGINPLAGYYRSGKLFGALTISGLFYQEAWNQTDCSQLVGATAIAADGLTGCDGFAFYEDGTETLTATTEGGNVFARLSTSLTAGGAGVFANAPSTGAFIFGTSTPKLEVTARIHTIQNWATSTRAYIGFTNIASAGTTYEIEPTIGCYFTASSSLANWQAVCRTSAAAQTVVDTGVASTTAAGTGNGHPYRFFIEADSVEAKFFIQSSEAGNLTQVAGITTTYPSTVALNAGAHFGGPTGVAARGIDIYDMNFAWRKALY